MSVHDRRLLLYFVPRLACVFYSSQKTKQNKVKTHNLHNTYLQLVFGAKGLNDNKSKLVFKHSHKLHCEIRGLDKRAWIPFTLLWSTAQVLRANVLASNDKIYNKVPIFGTSSCCGDYFARFEYAVERILLGIRELFGTRLKSDFSKIINTLLRRNMPKGIGTIKEVLNSFALSDAFQASELIQSEWAPCSWLASTFFRTTRPTGYFAGISLLIDCIDE